MSKGPYLAPISLNEPSKPESPPRNTFWPPVLITNEPHKVLFRVKPLPEKCRAGVQVTSMLSIRRVSHQSNSLILLAGTPHDSRCSPTPRGTQNAFVF